MKLKVACFIQQITYPLKNKSQMIPYNGESMNTYEIIILNVMRCHYIYCHILVSKTIDILVLY